MEMVREDEQEKEDDVSHAPSIADLVASLEHATHLAKQLPNITVDPSHFVKALHSAHLSLSLFLSHSSRPNLDHDDDDHEPMQVADVAEEEERRETMEAMEEKMRECYIQSKRPKRRRSPTPTEVEERAEVVGKREEFDPVERKLRALELVYQFHG